MLNFSYWRIMVLTIVVVHFIATILYWITNVLYNLYFHPLSKYPGRRPWAASRLPFIGAMIRGRYVHEVRDMHRRYGAVVRIAPNELSYASPAAWPVIHQRGGAQNPFLKNPIFITKPDSHPVESIPTTTNVKDHERMKRVLEKTFTRGSLALQEPIIQKNIDVMVRQLKDQVAKADKDGASINMTDWITHCTFDLMGDLAFGEPFGCLQNGKSHEWVSICTDFVKTLTFATALKYYPWIEALLKTFIPKALIKTFIEKERYHYEHTVRMVSKRLSLEKKREDFMTVVKDHMGKKNHMTFDEVCCNFTFLIVAGSETTAISLSGIMHYLAKTPEVLKKLEKEVRERFQDDMQIMSAVVADLPYLTAVIKEGLRMCSPVPAGNSKIVPPGGATICGEYIPAGIHVSVHPFTIHHSPQYFSEPDTFVPERWLEPRPENIVNHEPDAIHPFSMGSRKCLGPDLAWFEMRLMLAKLVHNFDIIADDGYHVDWQEQNIYLGVEKQPIMVKLQAR